MPKKKPAETFAPTQFAALEVLVGLETPATYRELSRSITPPVTKATVGFLVAQGLAVRSKRDRLTVVDATPKGLDTLLRWRSEIEAEVLEESDASDAQAVAEGEVPPPPVVLTKLQITALRKLEDLGDWGRPPLSAKVLNALVARGLAESRKVEQGDGKSARLVSEWAISGAGLDWLSGPATAPRQAKGKKGATFSTLTSLPTPASSRTLIFGVSKVAFIRGLHAAGFDRPAILAVFAWQGVDLNRSTLSCQTRPGSVASYGPPAEIPAKLLAECRKVAKEAQKTSA